MNKQGGWKPSLFLYLDADIDKKTEMKTMHFIHKFSIFFFTTVL